MGDKNLHKGHRERIRKRFLDSGGVGFCEHELLEMLLFYCIPMSNTNETAHRLINQFGSIVNVLNSDRNEFVKIKGVSHACADFMRYFSDLCLEEKALDNDILISDKTIPAYFAEYFYSSAADICLLIAVDDNGHIHSRLSFNIENFLSGDINPRSFVSLFSNIRCNSAVIGINHNNRSIIPEQRDYMLTRSLIELLAPFSVKVEDVMILSNGSSFSMKKTGAFSFNCYDHE